MRVLLVLSLLFSLSAFGSDVVLRRAFPQQYTEAQANEIKTLVLMDDNKDPRKKQDTLIFLYSEFVNGGRYNINEVTTYYHNGYLNQVEISVLPFSGAGNRLRLYIRVATGGDTTSERNFLHHRMMAELLLKKHRELVPIETIVGKNGMPFDPSDSIENLLCEEVLYLEPPWYDPKASLDSIQKKSDLRSASPSLPR